MITLRPLTDDDVEFLRELYATSRASPPTRTPWTDARRTGALALDFDAQHAHYTMCVAGADLALIEAAGVPIGRLYVLRLPEELRLLDISLLPEHRGRGIGSGIIRTLMDEAQVNGQVLCCDVERHNHRALALYLRLGLRPVFEDPLCTSMSWESANPS